MRSLIGASALFRLFCFSATLLKAEEYNVLNEPNSADPWSILDQDPAYQVEEIFKGICENYHLINDNEEIDCLNIRFRPRDPLMEDHVMRKRDTTGDLEVEASGNGAVTEVDKNEHTDDNKLNEKSANNVPKEHNENAIAAATVTSPTTPTTSKNSETPPAKVPATKDETKLSTNTTIVAQQEPQPESTTTIISQVTEGKIEEPSLQTELPVEENKTEPTRKRNETRSVVPVEAATVESTLNISSAQGQTISSPKEDNPQTELPVEENKTLHDETSLVVHVEAPVVKPKAKLTTSGSSIQEPKVLGSGENKTAEEPRSETSLQTPAVTEATSPAKEETTTVSTKESINEEQSGIAVFVNYSKDHGKIEGSDIDKTIDSIQQSAKNTDKTSDNKELKTGSIVEDKNARNTEPETAESSKSVSQAGGKDATILVSLFAVVLVIGAAALAHNYIKKRKQKTPKIANRIKIKPITSNNGETDVDIEQGTEMKPLMESEVVKEYSDSKKEVEA